MLSKPFLIKKEFENAAESAPKKLSLIILLLYNISCTIKKETVPKKTIYSGW